ncbi:MAG: RNA polymerase sigma-70 factor [Sphingobacterium sp.]|jgi:RNA polymerase sigma-70 factor (ECF subfamily)|uniref:RNA polymerase sigma factor n=1 Tax=unclassified Sphingobacterium TaxID=2609468 RepID=UPI00283B1242|nr:RNA polymerase sigma-70 factor [Sphingobacterium sp.]MDR3008100.1 RNA polymerase sigma-70 factor [Sphingobacterium sp.]
MEATEENTILNSLSQGDELSFFILYERYSHALFSTVFRMVKDKQVSEEIVQDVFLKVWQKRSTIDPNRSFKSWIFTIAKNDVISWYRKLAKEAALQENLYQHFEQLYVLEKEGDIQEKQAALLDRALNSLSERRKEIFVLCKIEQKSYEEVAQKLNISVSTVSNAMVKSNQHIRQFVQDHYDEILVILVGFYFF